MTRVTSYCANDDAETEFEYHLTADDHLIVNCLNCDSEHESQFIVKKLANAIMKECAKCNNETAHVRYLSVANVPHFFCVSCGRDM